VSDSEQNKVKSRDVPVLELVRASRGQKALVPVVTFNKQELSAILAIYGRMVGAGEWRDYALDFDREKAVFSVFRRSSETPLMRIEKVPQLARKQGAFAVVSGAGLVLKRGHELARVLSLFDKKLRLVP
jgi:hypothetical protein